MIFKRYYAGNDNKPVLVGLTISCLSMSVRYDVIVKNTISRRC